MCLVVFIYTTRTHLSFKITEVIDWFEMENKKEEQKNNYRFDIIIQLYLLKHFPLTTRHKDSFVLSSVCVNLK